ncbi:MAG: peptide chain release factor N(5)-glutamine methyltransferase [Planctomycetota bacterium]
MSEEPLSREPRAVRGLIELAAGFLARQGVPSARLDAEILLASALGLTRMDLYLAFDRALDEGAVERFRGLVRRRAAREPVAYILGEKEFYSLRFRVTPAVLIPRAETEHLVDEALGWARTRGKAFSALDLGTGSGCLAVALARAAPEARLTAVDLSEEALAVARENAVRHGVSGRIDFRRGDWYGPVKGERFDLVLCNPPYVDEEDPSIPPELKAYEPRQALFASEGGLAAYRVLAGGLAEALAPEGLALFELGAGRAEVIQGFFREAGFLHLDTRRDYGGRERVLRVSRAPLLRADAGSAGELVYEYDFPARASPGTGVGGKARRKNAELPSDETSQKALDALLEAYGRDEEEPPEE